MDLDKWMESEYCHPKQIMNAISKMRYSSKIFTWEQFENFVQREEQLQKDKAKQFSDNKRMSIPPIKSNGNG